MARRARRPEARPDEILDAALAVFTEHGFGGARMEEIAQRAGLSKGAIYLYFDSKQSILKALVRRLADRVIGAADALVQTDTQMGAEQTLRALFMFIATQISDPKVSAAPRLVLAEAQHFPEIAALYRDMVIARGRRLFERLCERGVAQGVFRPVDSNVLLRMCGGTMLAHMLLGTVFAHPDMPAPPAELLARELADVVLNGLKVKAEAP
jgi:AcrR family transcriptional regulator